MKKFAMHLLFFVGLYLAFEAFSNDYGLWTKVALLLPLVMWSTWISEKVYESKD